MKNDIKGKINTGQGEIKNSISTIQEEIKNDISVMRSSQIEFEEKVMDTLGKQLKGVTIVVEQWTQNLCEEFKSE
jgi:hypothetical protein